MTGNCPGSTGRAPRCRSRMRFATSATECSPAASSIRIRVRSGSMWGPRSPGCRFASSCSMVSSAWASEAFSHSPGRA